MTDFAAAFIRNDRILFNLINRKLHYRLLDLYFGMVTHLGSTPLYCFVGLFHTLSFSGYRCIIDCKSYRESTNHPCFQENHQ